MLNFNNYFTQGVNSTLRLKPGTNWSYKGQWIQIYEDTEIDRWYVGDFSSASYQITVEFNSNKKEILNALVIARPDEASVVISSRVSIDDDLITLSATVNDSYLVLTANPSNPSFEGAKVIFLATYTETIHDLTVPAEKTYLPENDPVNDIFNGGTFSGGTQTISVSLAVNDLLDANTIGAGIGDVLAYDGVNWISSSAYAPKNNPTFTGTVTGINSSMVGLGNVANESKSTMFASPTFTGTPTAPTASYTTDSIQIATTAFVKDVLETSPSLSGIPTAPTASLGTDTTQIATTAFVQDTIENLIGAAPSALDTLNELAQAINDDSNFASTISTSLAGKVSSNNPVLTGTVSIGTIAVNSTVNINGVLNAYSLRSYVKTGDTGVNGTYTMDCSKYDGWAFTVTGATTLAFSNIPSAGVKFTAFLYITQGSGGSLTFPTGTTWPSGLTPTFTATASRTDVFVLTTFNGGTIWYATLVGQNYP